MCFCSMHLHAIAGTCLLRVSCLTDVHLFDLHDRPTMNAAVTIGYGQNPGGKTASQGDNPCTGLPGTEDCHSKLLVTSS